MLKLPQELIKEILSYLNARDYMRCIVTCKRIHVLKLPFQCLFGMQDVERALRHQDEDACLSMMQSPLFDYDHIFITNTIQLPVLQFALQFRVPFFIEQLLRHPKCDPTWNNHVAIVISAAFQPDHLEMLLRDPKVNPAAQEQRALRVSCQEGISQSVALLLDDPRVRHICGPMDGLELASMHGHDAVVELLLGHPSVYLDAYDLKRAFDAAWHKRQATILSLLFLDWRFLPNDTESEDHALLTG
ncbi:hypothetical protein EDD86DRAFT_204484 [Gorgonomyces haynaldii]|nr:hypothetical protein EDD86DRAFT_204484 [Gorgonomyces haynaldii]